MAQRLAKIARELNVGISTIVEFLAEKGFEVEAKPTAKITEEMQNALLEKYSLSKSIKEKADQIIIGTRIPPKPSDLTLPDFSNLAPPAKKEEPAPVEEVEDITEQEVQPEPTPAVEPDAPAEVKSDESPSEEAGEPAADEKDGGLKVLGKIDLDGQKKKEQERKQKAKDNAIEEKQKRKDAKDQPKPEPVAEQPAPSEKEDTPQKESVVVEKKTDAEPKPDSVIRHKSPTLKGLKIMGKIDPSKLKEKKPESTPSDRGKRKRTRKKINPGNFRGGNKGGNKKKKSDEVTTVSQKEIEEKIKATMARISGVGGKKKRQKIRRDSREQKREKQEQLVEKVDTGLLKVTEFISVSELASVMNVPVSEVITKCMSLGVIVSINQRLDAEIIELVANEFEFEIEFIDAESEQEQEEEIIDDPADLEPRAPIVTVMGHVDHGKTSLLDYIRNETVADGEAGGITQHIGAYEVLAGESKNKITFLDTPGHEAFTAMRARGAKVTDVVVIIIAADDRIMPQTKEAISHAQAAGVPMIFAINKIDKDGANPDRIKQELSEMNLLIEEWGGKYQSQDISAKAGTNIPELLEKIILESEVLDLKANPSRAAIGAVLEASLDKGRGYVTKVLVENGTLKIGDVITAGSHSGKVKAMFNDRGQKIKEAGPATPVLILGLNGAPQAGEKLKVFETEQEAKATALRRERIEREQSNRANKRISLDEIGRRLALGTFKELNLIVKGDVDGSIEALSDSLIKLSQETVQVNVIHKAVGQIIESDVLLASASDAIIVGFQVRPSLGARQLSEKEGVQIKTYSIIYEAIEEIKLAIEGMLDTIKEEVAVCQVEVRETYKISKIGTIAGCYVQDGKLTRNTKIRLIRDGIVVYPVKEGVTGELTSLKRYKDDVKEVSSKMECGLTIKNFNDIKIGDVIEGYEIVETKQTIK
jgi:translation initiation factor IF-2